MQQEEFYANGQKVHELTGNRLVYYFKDGTVKAEGGFENGEMTGEWRFYRATGELWQVGHFRNNKKHGTFVRYDRSGQVEYYEEFEDDKKLKGKRG